MAAFVHTNSKLVIDGTDLSDHLTSAQASFDIDMQDSTAMGATYHTRLAGLRDLSLDLELNQDFAASKTDATIWGAIDGANFAVTWKPVNTTTSSTNPEYQANMFVANYRVIGQSVGQKAAATVRLMVDGTVTRATS